MVETAVCEFGAVHILVSNDGAPPIGRLQDFDEAESGVTHDGRVLALKASIDVRLMHTEAKHAHDIQPR